MGKTTRKRKYLDKDVRKHRHSDRCKDCQELSKLEKEQKVKHKAKRIQKAINDCLGEYDR